MLPGRADACGRVDALIAAALDGRSGTLVVRGEPGAGKSTLLGWAAGRARGAAVLSARGVASEAELSYAALADLLRPLGHLIDALPAVQAEALRGALALGAPPRSAADRFATYSGTLSLLAAAATDAPLLALVDDLQWVDPASAEALLFAARRLDAEGVAVILATEQPDEPGGFDEMVLGALDADAAATVLASAAGVVPAPEVAAALARAVRGNPLALRELAHALTRSQLEGDEPVPDALPVGAAVERAFAPRLAALDTAARRILLVAAAEGSGDLGVILAAAPELGGALDELERAEAAGLVELADGHLTFLHPLVASAVHASAPAAERRAAHAALAAVLTGPAVAERRAWHLATAAAAPDEGVARELEAVAEVTFARSGYAAASAALERAAALTVVDAERARRLLAAAEAARRAGRPAAATRLLEAAEAVAADPATRAAARHLHGRVELFAGRSAAAAQLMGAAGSELLEVDPDAAATMLAEAALASFLAGDVGGALGGAVLAQGHMTTGGGIGELIVKLILGTALFHAGQVADGFRTLVEAAEIAEGSAGERPEPEYVVFASLALGWAGQHGRARALVGGVVEETRRASALGVLPYALYASAYLNLRTGRFPRAAAEAEEAVRLAGDTGAVLWRYFGLGCLALIEAIQGKEEACRAHAAEAAELGAVVDIEYPRDHVDALGLLELALGRPDDAIAYLEPANRVGADGQAPVLARPSAPDLVEAYVRAARPVPAAMAAELVRQSEDEEFATSAAVAWRCRALLAGNGDADDAFEHALALHERADTPFDRARTLLCFGERLRRDGRRVDARERLRSALAVFDQLGAVPWARRAAAELRATGDTPKARGARTTDALTPQELQIARAVASGASNREAAAALFLSPKTVEMHLTRVYRKLEIRSRAQLAAVYAALDDADAPLADRDSPVARDPASA